MNAVAEFSKLDVAKLAAIGLLHPHPEIAWRPVERQLFVHAAGALLACAHLVAGPFLLDVMTAVRARDLNLWPSCHVMSGTHRHRRVEVLDLTMLVIWGVSYIQAQMANDKVWTENKDRLDGVLCELITVCWQRWALLLQLSQDGRVADATPIVPRLAPYIEKLNNAMAAFGPLHIPSMTQPATRAKLGPNVVRFPPSPAPRA